MPVVFHFLSLELFSSQLSAFFFPFPLLLSLSFLSFFFSLFAPSFAFSFFQ